jgi:hypothetical protein
MLDILLWPKLWGLISTTLSSRWSHKELMQQPVNSHELPIEEYLQSFLTWGTSWRSVFNFKCQVLYPSGLNGCKLWQRNKDPPLRGSWSSLKVTQVSSPPSGLYDWATQSLAEGSGHFSTHCLSKKPYTEYNKERGQRYWLTKPQSGFDRNTCTSCTRFDSNTFTSCTHFDSNTCTSCTHFDCNTFTSCTHFDSNTRTSCTRFDSNTRTSCTSFSFIDHKVGRVFYFSPAG